MFSPAEHPTFASPPSTVIGQLIGEPFHPKLYSGFASCPIVPTSPIQPNQSFFASNVETFAMRSKKSKQAKPWSMYPSLHDDVSDLLQEDGLFFDFHEEDDDEGCTKDYDTNIMGRFNCHNSACPARGWSSKKIAIRIRMYSHEEYNARVYFQRCKSCQKLSEPLLDETSYAERVAYRLKKWCGVRVDTPSYSGRSDGPHRRDLCEGCKQGHCSGLG
jgi:Zinc-binding domain